ncbi:Hypothetical predicted protein [Pelobates cultripes]|uniref:Uncharacterized protein n=1 Tax=Pelobates cultripes TaxID=61616 RepID=A0AAD1TD82_PELCU|nr:Hypothetical predicted protein [Pelobates cultripes]
MSTFLTSVVNPDPGSIDINNVFSLNPLNTVPGNDMSEVFFLIQKLYQQQIKGYWELVSLKQYIDQKLVPRGLRPEIPLPDKVTTEEQTQEWNSILLECSAKLMQFLIKLESQNLEITNQNLEKELVNVKTFKDQSEFPLMENKLQKNLDSFKKHIKEKKHLKFLRDHKDFKEGNIFRLKRKPRTRNFSRNSSTSGNTDWMDSDSGSSRSNSNRRTRDYSDQTRGRSILKKPNRGVTFPVNPESGNHDTTKQTERVEKSSSSPFLEEDWPLPSGGRLRDRKKWGYKPDKRINLT